MGSVDTKGWHRTVSLAALTRHADGIKFGMPEDFASGGAGGDVDFAFVDRTHEWVFGKRCEGQNSLLQDLKMRKSMSK